MVQEREACLIVFFPPYTKSLPQCVNAADSAHTMSIQRMNLCVRNLLSTLLFVAILITGQDTTGQVATIVSSMDITASTTSTKVITSIVSELPQLCPERELACPDGSCAPCDGKSDDVNIIHLFLGDGGTSDASVKQAVLVHSDTSTAAAVATVAGRSATGSASGSVYGRIPSPQLPVLTAEPSADTSKTATSLDSPVFPVDPTFQTSFLSFHQPNSTSDLTESAYTETWPAAVSKETHSLWTPGKDTTTPVYNSSHSDDEDPVPITVNSTTSTSASPELKNISFNSVLPDQRKKLDVLDLEDSNFKPRPSHQNANSTYDENTKVVNADGGSDSPNQVQRNSWWPSDEEGKRPETDESHRDKFDELQIVFLVAPCIGALLAVIGAVCVVRRATANRRKREKLIKQLKKQCKEEKIKQQQQREREKQKQMEKEKKQAVKHENETNDQQKRRHKKRNQHHRHHHHQQTNHNATTVQQDSAEKETHI